MQPGLPFYSLKRHQTKISTGSIERVKQNLDYVFRYNRLHQPVSLEIGMGPYVF